MNSFRVILFGCSLAVVGLLIQQTFVQNPSYAEEDAMYKNLEQILSDKLKQGYEILTIKHLDKVTSKYFVKTYPDKSPGYVCSPFRNPNIIDCGVLLLNKTFKRNDTLLALAVIDIDSGESKVTEIFRIEEKKYHGKAVFLYYSPKWRVVFNHGEWKEVTMSTDGFEVVFFESSSILYYWEKDKLKHFWTSD